MAYQYQVQALNGAVTGPLASVVVQTATSLAAPTQFGTGGAATKSSLPLQWQATTNALATGYVIERCVGTAAVCNAVGAAWLSLPAVAGRNTQKFTDTGLASKTSYSYRMHAVSSVAPLATASSTAVIALKTL